MAPDAPSARRLAAVAAFEFVDFPRRRGANGARAVEDAAELQRALGIAAVANGGRLLDGTGEGEWVAEFPSAGGAAGCARQVLQEIAARNLKVDPARRLPVRAAVHAGEFEATAAGLSGDGLTVAKRLVAIADAGGLALSEPVWSELRRQMPLRGRLVAARGETGKIRAFVVPPAGANVLFWSLSRGGWRAPAAAVLVAALVAAGAARWRLGRTSVVIAALPGIPAGAATAVRLLHTLDSLAGTFPYAGGGSTVVVDSVADGWRGRAARVRYTLAPGAGFWGFAVGVGQSLDRSTGVRVHARAEGGRPVRVQIEEDGGELWVAALAPGPAWAAFDLPFGSFARRAEYNTGVQDGRLDLTRVKTIQIIQSTAPGADTLWVDELEVIAAGTP